MSIGSGRGAYFLNYHAPYGPQARIFGFVPKKYAPEALQAGFLTPVKARDFALRCVFTHCSTKFSVGFSRVFLRLIRRVILLRGAFLRIFQLNSMGVSGNEVRNFASTLSYTYTP